MFELAVKPFQKEFTKERHHFQIQTNFSKTTLTKYLQTSPCSLSQNHNLQRYSFPPSPSLSAEPKPNQHSGPLPHLLLAQIWPSITSITPLTATWAQPHRPAYTPLPLFVFLPKPPLSLSALSRTLPPHVPTYATTGGDAEQLHLEPCFLSHSAATLSHCLQAPVYEYSYASGFGDEDDGENQVVAPVNCLWQTMENLFGLFTFHCYYLLDQFGLLARYVKLGHNYQVFLFMCSVLKGGRLAILGGAYAISNTLPPRPA